MNEKKKKESGCKLKKMKERSIERERDREMDTERERDSEKKIERLTASDEWEKYRDVFEKTTYSDTNTYQIITLYMKPSVD